MKIALAQIDCDIDDVAANCEKFSAYCQRAAESKCDLVVFPEMSDTGYQLERVAQTASSWPEGRPFQTLQAAAREHKTHIIAGLSERVGNQIYNSLAVLGPSGDLLQRYRKTHVFTPAPVHEDKYIAPGESFGLVEIGEFRVGLSICFDLRFPEIYRALTNDGATLLVNCAAWPALRNQHWDYLTRARAIENQACVIGVNRIGSDANGLDYSGDSMAIAADGSVLADPLNESGAFQVCLEGAALTRYRESFPCHLDADGFRIE